MSDFDMLRAIPALTKLAGQSTYGFFAAVALATSLVVFISPADLVHRHSPIAGKLPDEAYVGRKVADFALSPPSVLVLGGSSMRESMPTPANFGASLVSRCGYAPSLFNAATSSQHPADGWAIIDALGGTPHLIVVGLTYRRMIFDPSNDPYNIVDQRVELPRSRTAALIAASKMDIRSGLFDFMGQIGRLRFSLGEIRRARHFRGPVPSDNLDAFDNRDALGSSTIPDADKRFTGDKWIAAYGWVESTQFEPLTSFWRDFAARLQSRGARVIFVVTPEGPEMRPAQRATDAPFEHAISNLRLTAEVADFRNSVDDPSLFHDPIHLTNRGQETLWPELSNLLAQGLGCQSAVPVL